MAPAPTFSIQSLMNSDHQVVVTDMKMPFGSMVTFRLKWAIATIPAVFILIGLSLVVVIAGREQGAAVDRLLKNSEIFSDQGLKTCEIECEINAEENSL